MTDPKCSGCRGASVTHTCRAERPLNPTPEMIDAGAQRLVRWEDGCVWPDSWSPMQVAAARNEAERVWRSMYLEWSDPMTDPVIYANPATQGRIPAWATHVVQKDDAIIAFSDGHKIAVDLPDGAVLARYIRPSETAYYAPENPHTDDEGRLPHDGGPLPEFLAGKKVEMITTDSDVPVIANYGGLKLGDRPPGDHVTAYRIVETLPTPGISGRMRSAQKAMYGSEGREAGDPIPSSSRSRLDFYTDEEVKHRNELAAHLGVPVPGMSEWLREPLREARRVRYREAVIIGSGAVPIESSRGVEALRIVDAMLEQEG